MDMSEINGRYEKSREAMRASLADVLTTMMTDVDTFQRQVLDLPLRIGSLEPRRLSFKLGHMREELAEFHEAWVAGDFPNQVDALVDLIYVAMGALLEMGVTPGKAFTTVHEANMKKVRGETKRGESYDAVKPDGWEPPCHEALIAKMTLLAQVRPALLEATSVMAERAAKYNGGTVRRADHFPLGTTSTFQQIWLKAIRMRSCVERGEPIARDHAIDLINYAGFMVDQIDGRDLG